MDLTNKYGRPQSIPGVRECLLQLIGASLHIVAGLISTRRCIRFVSDQHNHSMTWQEHVFQYSISVTSDNYVLHVLVE